jgi:hypothetical protein
MKNRTLLKVTLFLITIFALLLYNQHHTAYFKIVQQHPEPFGFDQLHQQYLQDQIASCQTRIMNITDILTRTEKTSTNREPIMHDKQIDEDALKRLQREIMCRNELNRVTTKMTDHVHGITEEDYERSVAHVGNRHRLSKFVHKLMRSITKDEVLLQQQHQNPADAVTVVVCGGSITLGHGIEPITAAYSDALEVWLNDAYPIAPTDREHEINKKQQDRHRVMQRGGHGANVSSRGCFC